MSEEEVKVYFKEKLKELAVHVCTVVFDTALGGVWLAGEYCLEHFLVPRFHVDSPISVVALWIIRILFAASTLIPCASNVYRHVRIEWLRDKAKIRQTKEELRAKEMVSAAGGESER